MMGTGLHKSGKKLRTLVSPHFFSLGGIKGCLGVFPARKLSKRRLVHSLTLTQPSLRSLMDLRSLNPRLSSPPFRKYSSLWALRLSTPDRLSMSENRRVNALTPPSPFLCSSSKLGLNELGHTTSPISSARLLPLRRTQPISTSFRILERKFPMNPIFGERTGMVWMRRRFLVYGKRLHTFKSHRKAFAFGKNAPKLSRPFREKSPTHRG
jgi:hypothetical protein